MNTLLPVAVQLAGLLLSGIVGLLGKEAIAWLRQRADSEVRTYLVDMVELGVDRIAVALRTASAPEARSAAVATEAAYVAARAPDALARFGLDTAGAEAMIEKRLAARGV